MKRLLILLIFSLTLLVACDYNSLADQAIKSISIPDKIDVNFVLPTSPNAGVEFTWEVSPSNLYDEEMGFMARENDTPVELTLNAKQGSKSVSKKYTITLEAVDDEIFQRAWDYYRPYISNTITRDFTFHVNPLRAETVRYKSTNQDIITDEGVVTKTTSDQKVVIQCFINYKGLERMFEKEITLTKYNDSTIIKMVEEWVPSQVEAYMMGEIASLPISHPEFGTRIRWTSPNTDVLIVEGHVLKKDVAQNFYLTADLFYSTYESKQYYEVENFSGGSTEEEILDMWLPSLLPSEILGSINYLREEHTYMHLDYQVRTNVGGVLNPLTGEYPFIIEDLLGLTEESVKGKVSSGYRPVVNQAKLDQEFYPGYVVQNDLNIIWIVVHESGMPNVANNADLLNDVMHRKMINNDANSSWHYSVDEGKIYHHIPNEFSAWHASDGSTNGGGNRNGIGIEMCINQDGNYEGSLHNDAKLIAYLLHEYNLTLANVRRHYDFAPDKKECPSYMLRTYRYNEFLDLVNKEYIAMTLLKNANVQWTISNLELFTEGGNGLLFNKKVSSPTDVNLTLSVNKGSYSFTKSAILTIGATNE